MKFAAKRDKPIGVLFLTIWMVCIASILIIVMNMDQQIFSLLLCLLLLVVIGITAWIWLDTSYQLDDKKLFYKTGPFQGSLEINKIVKVTKNQTLAVGLKPALARNGLIVRFNKWDEVYIAPLEPEILLAELLNINREIEVEAN